MKKAPGVIQERPGPNALGLCNATKGAERRKEKSPSVCHVTVVTICSAARPPSLKDAHIVIRPRLLRKKKGIILTGERA